MAYIINRFDGTELTIVDDGILDNSTPLGLIGRNYTGYGEVQNENFIFLLENFANESPPARALSGQAWYDKSGRALKVFNGTTWLSIGNATVSETEPAHSTGGLWLKTTTDQLYVSNGTTWNLVGPEGVEGFAVTKLTSRSLRDANTGSLKPVIVSEINGETTSIITNESFVISDQTPVDGFSQLNRGINLKSNNTITGSLTGNADTASELQTARKINNVNFDGSQDITITANTTYPLVPGDYINGTEFNGGFSQTWDINATPENLVGTVVARDSTGGFSATQIIADVFGDLQGNVTAINGTSTFDQITVNNITGQTFSGLAARATRLAERRTINTIPFDGTESITLPVPAETLVGTELATNVVNSSLVTLGKLESLAVEAPGIVVGDGNNLYIRVEGFTPTLESDVNHMRFKLATGSALQTQTHISYISAQSAGQTGVVNPALVPDYQLSTIANQRPVLGLPQFRWRNVYSEILTSDTTVTATLTGPTVPGQPNQVTVSNNLVVAGSAFGNLVGNVTGNLQGNVTGAASLNMLKSGDTMTGDLSWTTTGRGLSWSMNSDGASIRFYNAGDSDLNSRLEFHTSDNGNEYFSWAHSPSGGSKFEAMTLVPNTANNSLLTVTGSITASGTMTATHRGDGNQLTNLNATQILTGTVPAARLSGTYNITVNGTLIGNVTGNLTGNVTGNLTGNVTGSASQNVLKIGDTMTGDLTIQKANAWLSLDSPSDGTEGANQAAGISIGESGYKGSATLHMTYTGDGYSHIGMGPINSSTSLPAYEAIRLYYLDNTVRVLGNMTVAGTASGTFSGTGTGLSLSANNLVTGTVPSGRLSGTYAINITGNAQTATTASTASANILRSGDTMTGRLGQSVFGFHATSIENISVRTNSGFFDSSSPTIAEGWPVNGSWHHLLSSTHTNDANYYAMQFSADFYNQNLYYRSTAGSGSTAWNKILHNNNYNDYAPTKTGTGASGTWNINITGNAASASSVGWASVTGKPNLVFNDGGTYSVNITGNAGSASQTPVVSNSGRVTAESNGSSEPTGLRLREVYSNGYPTSYGNALTLGGAGGGELLIGWSGTSGAHADNYVRSRRDTGSTWSSWAKIITDVNYNSYAPSLSGTGAYGTWPINVSGQSATVASISSGQIASGLGYTPISKSGDTVNGELNLQDYNLRRATIIDYSLAHNILGNVSGSTTVNLELGNYVSATATGAVTWTFANPPTGARVGSIIMELTNGGAYTMYWPASVRWPSGSAPSLAASGVDVLVFITDDGGSNWRGAISMGDSR